MSSAEHIPRGYAAQPDLLQGRVILISGAGDGIGRQAALSCAAHGATVVLLGRTVEKLEAVYDEIEAAGGAQPAIYPLDLNTAEPDDYQQLLAAVGETFDCLHGLLHNAGVLGEMRPISDYRYGTWQNVMRVNVDAGFMLTQALLPLLQAAPDASVVFTSSGVGHKGRAFWGAYAVSKFATEGLMQVLADELEGTSAIRVNSLNPGATNTAMRRSAYPGEEPTKNPDPAAIMPTYLYLLGNDSIGVTGRCFNAQ